MSSSLQLLLVVAVAQWGAMAEDLYYYPKEPSDGQSEWSSSEAENCSASWPLSADVLNVPRQGFSCEDAERYRQASPVRLVPKYNREIMDHGGKFGLDRIEHQFQLYSEMLSAEDVSMEVLMLDTQWTHPLTDFLVDLSFLDLSHVRKKYVEVEERTGRVLGVPNKPNQQGFLYRKDLFAKHGLEYPDQSWEQFEEVLTELQRRERAAGNTDFYPLGIALGKSTNRATFNFVTLLSGLDGGQIIEADGRVTVNNPRAARMLEMWRRWYGTLIAPETQMTNRHVHRTEHFFNNKSAVMLGWVADTVQFFKHMEEHPSWGWEIGIGPIPGPTGAGCMGTWYYSLSKHVRRPEAAKEYLRVAMSKESVVARSFALSNADYATEEIRRDPVLWERYCSLNPIICSSKERWPDFWERAVYRPSQVCGTLYDRCTQIVYDAVWGVMDGAMSGEEAVAKMEADLNVL
eukprot:Sspe_Gene.95103::Locus_67429_Transcript_2_3_Confidence_0.500_Length_1439::g.95103::m.95103/K10236/thuE; trehalose/maltose transport system substrate-binding protein